MQIRLNIVVLYFDHKQAQLIIIIYKMVLNTGMFRTLNVYNKFKVRKISTVDHS